MLPENFNLIINLQIPQFEILLNFIPNPCQYDTKQQPQSELYNQNNPYLWPRSKCWIRAYKRVFNTLRLKSHIWIILII